MRRRAVLAALLLASCSGEGDAPPPAADTTASAPVQPEQLVDTRTAGVYVDRDVCPFECCVYGKWTTSAPIPVYAREGDTTELLFRLAAREEFTARTGSVHLNPTGLVVVRDTLTLEDAPPAPPLRLSPGDTVEVLSPIGEGYYRVRHEGRLIEVPGFWEVPHTDPATQDAEMVRPLEWRWWAEVQRSTGERGYIDMTSVSEPVWGVDACGGPPPPA